MQHINAISEPLVILGDSGSIRWGLVLVFIAVAIGCLIGAVHESRLRRRDTQLGLRAVLLINGLWLGFQALGLVTTDEAVSSTIYIGGLICGLTGVGAWMYFVSAYTGRTYHRNRRYRGVAVAVYIGLLIVKLTNPLYGLYVTTELQQSPYPHLVVEPQLMYWFSFSLTYTLVAISFYWLTTTLRKSSFPTGSLGVLAVLALSPILPRLAVSALPSEVLPPIMLGLSFEPLGVTAFLAGVLVFVGKPFRQLEQSARSNFFEQADNATFVYGTDGRLVELNTQAQELQSAIGTELQTVEAFEQVFSSVSGFDSADACPIEFDGATRYFEVTANQMTTGAEVVGTVATVRDITERRSRKRELQSFQRAVDEAADGVAILEGDEYVYVDQTHVEMYGFDTADELLGNTWRKLYDDAEIARLEDEAFPTLQDDGNWRGMVTGSRPDGSTFPAELSLTIVGDGRLVCTVRDETERLARERELKLKERAMDEANVGIQISDGTQEENPLIYVNDGFEQITGYSREKALGRNPRFLQGPESDPERVARLRAAVENEEPVTMELVNYRPDETPYWAKLSVTPVYDDDETLQNFIAIQQDVTERKERKQQAEARVDLLERIYEVTTDPQMSFEEKINGLLDAGRDHLDLPYGFLTRFDMDDDPTAGTQTVLEAVGSHELLQSGESGPLSESYCQRTIDHDGAMAITNAAESDLVDDIAYDTFGLQTYIGGNVVVADDVYGTLCFASSEQRESSFDEFERTLVSLLGQWTGYEIERRNARKELRQQQERLELALSGTNTGIAEWDLQTDAVTWNETLVELVGRDVESVEEFRDAIYPDDRDYVQRELETMLETGEPWTGEFRVADEDGGDSLWLGTRATPVYGDNGGPVRVLATGTDISDRKDEERKRRRNEQRYETLLEAAPDPIFVADVETGEIVEANAAAEELRGQSRDDLIGQHQTNLHPEENIELYEDVFEKSVGNVSTITELPDGTQPELVTLDGETVPVEISVASVSLPEGPVIYGVFRDISERWERQRELKLKERAMDEANVGITISDPNREDNPLIYVNDGFVDQTGYTRHEVLGRNCRFLQNDDRDQPALDELRDAIAAEEPKTVQLRNYRKNGEQFWNRLSVTPIYEDGELVNHVGIQQDVTDEVRRKQRLYEERERFRLLTESVNEYAFLVVDDGIIQTWNAGAEKLFGYDAEAALGMSTAELHPDSDHESDLPERLLQQARIAGESAHEGWRVRADGSEFYADVRYAPLESDDGEFRGYAMIVRDMTERRRQRRRTERFVEESEDVVTVVDPDGTVTYASGSAERVLGYDPDDLVGENLFDYLHPDGREQTMETFFSCVETSESVTADCRLKSPDGGWFNIEGRCRNMVDDDAIDGILVYLRDVTETKERARRFESIFNQTFQFTGLLETDGTVIEANDAAVEFGGFERSDIIGNPFYEARWWTHSEIVYGKIRDAIERAASGEFVRYETEVRGSDGLATIDFSVKPVTNEDDETTLLVVEGRDITGQQQRSRHLRVMQRVMRHNMRNDLGKIRGWTELMSEESDPKDRAEQFRRVESILDKWDSMTEKMKEITQALQSEDGKLATTASGPLIEDVANQVREEHTAATIHTDGTDGESVQVPTTFRKAVHELVENAVEVKETATVDVTACLEDDWIEISVTDDGPGMPEMEADVLETGEEDPLNHGKGLGLWMVRMIVTQAGGNVLAESTTDGTEVRLRVPSEHH